MIRSKIKELHYITHIDNLTSILQHGIFGHNKAKKIRCKSVADPIIQERRAKVVVPGGMKLHTYANLYFNARNPMMFKRKGTHKELIVLKIDPAILDEPKVVISDGNASSDYVRFYPSPEGLKHLDKDLIFADDWRDSDRFQYYRRKSAICAEVLAPDFVPAKFIVGIYVSCQESHQKVVELTMRLPLSKNISINPKLFFL